MTFRIVGSIEEIETIATGRSIRILKHLRKKFRGGRWRKMKGLAQIELEDGSIRKAELHWFESHGVGRVYVKRKRYVD
jgi:hypothetical protein